MNHHLLWSEDTPGLLFSSYHLSCSANALVSSTVISIYYTRGPSDRQLFNVKFLRKRLPMKRNVLPSCTQIVALAAAIPEICPQLHHHQQASALIGQNSSVNLEWSFNREKIFSIAIFIQYSLLGPLVFQRTKMK